MATKPQSFKLDEKKQTITLYTNVEQTQVEKTLIEFYLGKGYAPLFAEKKKGKTVAEMREELEANDKETLEKFNNAYSAKNGFHSACKIYSEWVKAKKAKEAEEADK